MNSKLLTALVCVTAFAGFARAQEETGRHEIPLSTSKMLIMPVPGAPQRTNSFPTAVALSPDGQYLAILNNGYGTKESRYEQSIAVLNLGTNQATDFPDPRLAKRAHQTYFLGLGFSADGAHLYASIASRTDPGGTQPGDTGNGIAVYRFEQGRLSPERFIKIPSPELGPDHPATHVSSEVAKGKAVPFPAGLAVIGQGGQERLLVADNLSDDAVLLDASTGGIVHRFDLSTHPDIPASYPYGVAATRDGKRGYCSLWNASAVAELDLEHGTVTRMIPLLAPQSPTSPGSHPTAMLLSPDETRLYVTLSNSDRVAVIDTATGTASGWFSTEPPGQKYGGSFPNALAQSADGSRVFVADASTDAVAVLDAKAPGEAASPAAALGFIPTEWYPTALAVHGDELLIATGKGEGVGPNGETVPPAPPGAPEATIRGHHPYIAGLIHGSIARVKVSEIGSELSRLTHEVEESNRMLSSPQDIRFAGGSNPIKHVIYIIKENRSYDQVFGDLKAANGDPSLCMYCEDITPNQHALARQFGILDNFYVSGEVSGNGHVWSMAAITSDYTEKTWEIGYRGEERTYDYEGEVGNAIPLLEGQPDVNEPDTGYLWGDVARAGLTHRNYGEYIATRWCNNFHPSQSPLAGTPSPRGEACARAFVAKGQPLPANVGEPHGGPSPWPWQVPVIARDVATKPELEGHFDPRYADFNLYYPDQLRADEFLNEFGQFVKARQDGQGAELPQFVILRLPDDHTAGTRPGGPRPTASIADNDLAVGRVVDAVSHSPYWDDTAIFILEDDAQDGPDHVDAHRSPALVISKYSASTPEHPLVDHHFYTTVNMVRTMEDLLNLPPMNNNDAWAEPMAPLFTGRGDQPPFQADYRNRDNGLIYQMNAPQAPGAKTSAAMDFSHADAVDSAKLNAILWRDRKGNAPMPPPRHTVIRDAGDSE